MTHEQYVTLETAKLLKEAGFDWECLNYYKDGDEELIPPLSLIVYKNWNKHELTYSAPTQAVAQRWLRKKGYNVQVNFDYVEDTPEAIYPVWSYEIEEMTLQAPYPRTFNDFQYNSYEAALEAGLQKCLTFLL